MVLGIDLGGTKLATALFTGDGKPFSKKIIALDGRTGTEVGALITRAVSDYLKEGHNINSIGISVPGIARAKTGTVWAPNIPGWEDYPLVADIRRVVSTIPVSIDSDRGCSILGEVWQGNARGCKDAIFLAVGTGIGAGILADGRVLRGADDIAGSVGWLALDKPFQQKYVQCGCFEYYASGDGVGRLTRELLAADSSYQGELRHIRDRGITAHDVFDAFDRQDVLAARVFQECVQYWGMAVANLVSIFNPEKIIFGGGVFGSAVRFLNSIHSEARKWAQPISMSKVAFDISRLDGDAAIYGAGFLALKQPSNN